VGTVLVKILKHNSINEVGMKFSKDELMQCIFDCVEESLPDSWEVVKISANVSATEVNSEFRYAKKGDVKEIEFTPKNFIASLNACREYLEIICSEGKLMNHMDVEITAAGSMNVICSNK
jgi:hypothetical protein